MIDRIEKDGTRDCKGERRYKTMNIEQMKKIGNRRNFFIVLFGILKKWIFRNDRFLLRVLWVCGILFVAIDTPLALCCGDYILLDSIAFFYSFLSHIYCSTTSIGTG